VGLVSIIGESSNSLEGLNQDFSAPATQTFSTLSGQSYRSHQLDEGLLLTY
jgi:hypothetical protein